MKDLLSRRLVRKLGWTDLPSSLSADEVDGALRRTLLAFLRPTTLIFSILYGLITLVHLLYQPPEVSSVMVPAGLVTALLLYGVHHALARGVVDPRWGHELMLGILVLLYGLSLLHLSMKPQPGVTAIPLAILLVAGVALVSTRHLLVFYALAVTGWALVLLLAELPHSRIQVAITLGVQVVISAALHVLFRIMARRLHALHLGSEQRTAQLQATVSALEQLREKYELLAHNVSDVIWIRNLDFSPVYISPSVHRLRGYSAYEVMTQPPEDVFSPESYALARDWLAQELKRDDTQGVDPDRTQIIELEVPHKDGHTVWTEARVRFLRDEAGSPVGIVGISRDITRRRRARARLSEVMAELTRSNRELEHFAYIASHDLKEPLRVITSHLGQLQRRAGDTLNDRALRNLQHSVESAGWMQAMIDGLLAYSRYGAGQITPRRVPLDAVLDEALDKVSVSLEEAGVRVTRAPLPVVHGDRQKLTRLMQNLLSNAIRFRRSADPRIHVVSHSQPGSSEVVLEVRDNGIGIAPEDHERVFRIFERLHTRQEYPGTGIGLALCQRIAEQHGGRIWLESQPGKGTTFFVSLPEGRARAGDVDPAGPPET